MKKIFLSFLLLFLLINYSYPQYYFNYAYSFPGSAGNYAVTDPGSQLSITGSFTVECWVKQAVNTGAQIVVQKRLGSAAAGYTMYLSTGRIAIRTNSSTRLTGTTTIPVNVWTHIAATYNSSTNVFTVYVNGTADGTVTTAGAAPAADTDSLRFAAGFNSPFNGMMDEIRVWNVERTQTEIQETMRIPLGETGTVGPYTGLVGSWRGNTPAGGSGVDEINGNTAYLRGTASFVSVGNQPGGYTAFNTGILLPGTAGNYISAPPVAPLNITGSFTLECWINPVNSTSPSFQNVIAKRLSGSTGYELYLNAGRVTVRTNGSTRLSGTTVLPNNVWSHVAVTYNSATTTFMTYVNGVSDGSTVVSGTPVTNSDSLYFGRGINSPFAGLVDEMRISNYTKTAEELQRGMFVSIDANNEPLPASNTNIAYSFEGTLAGTDGSSRGAIKGDGSVKFTRVYNNANQFPSPTNRWDAGNFSNGFRVRYSGLTFGSSPTTIRDSIFMPEGLTISDINVFVGVNHTFANDISVSLINPAGSTTRILYPGGAPDVGMHMVTIFDDQADSTIGGAAPWSPRVKPTNNLAIFNSQNSLGWWKIQVTDIFPSADNGILLGWGIQFNNQTVTGSINSGITGIPDRFMLYQNFPNPFNPATTVNYDLASDLKVKITIYDLLGREVSVPVNEFKKAGSYSLIFDGSQLASGIYFYKIEAGDFVDSKKMILVK